jgi:hypothetical protein
MTDAADLDVLEALARAATPGPWEADDPNDTLVAAIDRSGAYDYVASADIEGFAVTDKTVDQMKSNAAFIAAANPAEILVLIDRVRKAEADAARFRDLVSGGNDFHCPMQTRDNRWFTGSHGTHNPAAKTSALRSTKQ